MYSYYCSNQSIPFPSTGIELYINDSARTILPPTKTAPLNLKLLDKQPVFSYLKHKAAEEKYRTTLKILINERLFYHPIGHPISVWMVGLQQL